MHDPIELFREWHGHAAATGTASLPNAVCVSTVDDDGVPHARFVDLKDAGPAGFVFCTSYTSPKARQIEANPNVSLTFWWDHVGRQVRVTGRAARITDADADRYWESRRREAQLVSWAFEQSEPMAEGESVADRLGSARARFGDGAVPRPPRWGGYVVEPTRVEFLAFDESRVHRRVVYGRRGEGWEVGEVQP